MPEPIRPDVTRKQLAKLAGAFGRELQHFSEEVRDGRVPQYAHALADGPMVPADRQHSLIARQFQETLTEMVLIMGRLDQDTAHSVQEDRQEELARVRADARRKRQIALGEEDTQQILRANLGVVSPATFEALRGGEFGE